jgi:formylglycine-generating enzyme required for sulfatase activity
MIRYVLLAIALCGCSATSPLDPGPTTFGSVKGAVVAEITGDTIAGIRIVVGSASVTTDSVGAFFFDAVPTGSRTVTAEARDRVFHPSKVTIVLQEKDTVQVEFLLVERRQSDSIPMALINGGTFMMGNNATTTVYVPEAIPRHHVTITRPYYVSRHEVTQRLWQRMTGGNPSAFIDLDGPVTNVHYAEIAVFCNKLSEFHQLEPVYSGAGRDIMPDLTKNGFRLLTEAEWEFAASAGDTTALYAITDPINDYRDDEYDSIIPLISRYAWTEHNSGGAFGEPRPVGLLQPNAFGLYDMIGNVSEMVEDRYEPFSSEPAVDPLVLNTRTVRVVRGSSFGHLTLNNHSLRYRTWVNALTGGHAIGFRIARNK